MRRSPLLSLALAASACALPACVSDTPPADVATSASADVVDGGAGVEYGRALMSLDQRVDGYFYWRAQPGADARREADAAYAAVVSSVRLHELRLLATLADASDPTRRRIAAKALAFSKSPQAVPALVSALADRGDATLLTNASLALAELRSPLVPAPPLLDLLTHPDRDVRNHALLALWHSMAARRAARASALDPDEQRRALPLLEAALYDPDDAFVRGHAAACLGAIADPLTVDALLNVLPDPEPFVRLHAANALASVGDPKAIMPLVGVIDETPANSTARSAVLNALKMILERNGRTVPSGIPDNERAWRAFVNERLGPQLETQ